MKPAILPTSLVLALGLLAGCGGSNPSGNTGNGNTGSGASSLTGNVTSDGSSTVFPITEAVAEEFRKVHPEVRVTAAMSGTGGGFKKFGNGEIDLTGASRPIKPSEVELCTKNQVEYIELPVAYDGLAVLIHPKNTWAKTMTVAELKKIWEPEAQGKITKWSQVREGWPDRELRLYGAGVDSGTYDYFTQAIVGKEHSSRGDFTASEDDNVLVQGISSDEGALGFFGLAYYEENKDKLGLVAVDDGKDDNGQGGIQPSLATVMDGSYQPLSRPIFVYVNKKSLDKPQVAAFVKFYLTEATQLTKEVGYIPLSTKAYELAQTRADKRVTGSLFEGKGSTVGVRIDELLEKSQGGAK